MGRWRILVDGGRFGSIWLDAAAAGILKSRIAEDHVRIAKNRRGRRNGLWNWLGHREIAERQNGIRAFRRSGRRHVTARRLSRVARRDRAADELFRVSMESRRGRGRSGKV